MMGEEADADWEAGMLEAGRELVENDFRDKLYRGSGRCKAHKWSAWKEIGRTGDWFHPLIVERRCRACGATETDEH